MLISLLLACTDTPPPVPASLTLASRLDRIRALQDGRTDDAEEAVIRDLLLGTRGEELLSLKQTLDRGASANLHHLVFSDIDNDSVRTEIIAHLQVAASSQRRLQVLSDIDDSTQTGPTRATPRAPSTPACSPSTSCSRPMARPPSAGKRVSRTLVR